MHLANIYIYLVSSFIIKIPFSVPENNIR